FRKSFFAFPEALSKYQEFVPEHAGILTVAFNPKYLSTHVEVLRLPKVDALARPVSATEYAKLGRLCMLRLWDVKGAVLVSRRNNVSVGDKAGLQAALDKLNSMEAQ
ncbi:MAG: hypothetical protein AAGU11_04425, partial [Syntrophobacteraceae bacterium]